MAHSQRALCLAFISLVACGMTAAQQPPDVVSSDGERNTAMGSNALPRLTSGVANTDAGEAESVAYQTLSTLLLNELQRQREISQSQAAEVDHQREELAAQAQQLEELNRKLEELTAIVESAGHHQGDSAAGLAVSAYTLR